MRAIRIALKEKYNVAVSKSVESLSKIFDIEIAMTFIAKYHLDDAHQQLQVETDERISWETHGEKEFSSFYTEICAMPYIQKFVCNRINRDMLPHSHAIIFNRFKTTLRDVVWFNLGGDRAKIFVDKDGNALNQLSCHTIKKIEVIQNQARPLFTQII